MKCPQCQSDVPESADHCFNCGHVFKAQQVLIRGSMIAGRFEILAPLGKGGMGVVYKAKDHKLEEIVAIKVLRPETAADPDMERRFRTEIRLARKVRHRNVCGIHEYGDDGPLRYIVMEYIEGVDFRRILVEKGGLPAEEAFDTCIHTAEGLQAIHDAGIVHRDLKTANLMRDSHGVLRLMDFGIAKQVGAEAAMGATATATGLVIGTPEYMSPEQARGVRIVDHRTDIYALGIVAFEIFTGRVPFRGKTPLETILKHLQDAPPLEGAGAKDLPPPMVPVLRKALAKDPDERFSSAAEFLVAITQARDASGVAPLSRGPATWRDLASRSARAAAPLPSLTLATEPTIAPASGVTAVPAETSHPTVTQRAARAPHVLEPPRAEDRRKVAPARRTIPSIGALIGITVLLLVLAGGMTLLGRRSPPAQTGLPATTVPPALSPIPSPPIPASIVSGTLVIDAIPWGEVVEVVDAGGTHHEPSGVRYTPLAIPLPPGAYTVRVRNPGAAELLAAPATVRSQVVETVSVVFRRVKAEDYLLKTGF
jgi:eukaryotic-like serine/threonine-protein kinase